MSKQMKNRRTAPQELPANHAPAVPYRREGSAAPAPTMAAPVQKRRRRAPWLKIVLSLIVLAVLASGVFLVTHKSRFEVTANGDGTCTVTGWMGYDTTIEIPKAVKGMAVTAIGGDAFNNPLKLGQEIKTIAIPESVTAIEADAFDSCADGLTLLVPQDSCAAEFARMNGIACEYIE